MALVLALSVFHPIFVLVHPIFVLVDSFYTPVYGFGTGFVGVSPHICPSSPHICPSSPHICPSSPHICPSSPHICPSSYLESPVFKPFLQSLNIVNNENKNNIIIQRLDTLPKCCEFDDDAFWLKPKEMQENRKRQKCYAFCLFFARQCVALTSLIAFFSKMLSHKNQKTQLNGF